MRGDFPLPHSYLQILHETLDRRSELSLLYETLDSATMITQVLKLVWSTHRIGRDAKGHENSGVRSCACRRPRKPAVRGSGWDGLRTRKLCTEHIFFVSKPSHKHVFSTPPTSAYGATLGYMRVTKGRCL